MDDRTRVQRAEILMFTGHNHKECVAFIGDNFDNTLNYPNIKTPYGVEPVSAGHYIIKVKENVVVNDCVTTEEKIYLGKPDLFDNSYGGVRKKLTMIILMGNIGTGKSTTADDLAGDGNVVINADEITTMIGGGRYNRYDEKKKELYQTVEMGAITTALKQGFDVVIDRTNMKRETRGKYIALAKGFDAIVRVVNHGPGNKESLARRLKDSRGLAPDVWESVHKKFLCQYEPPELGEGINFIFNAFSGEGGE